MYPVIAHMRISDNVESVILPNAIKTPRIHNNGWIANTQSKLKAMATAPTTASSTAIINGKNS